jgi:hypothetical protein
VGESTVASKRFMAGLAAACAVGGLVLVYLTWRDHAIARANVGSTCFVVASGIATSTSTETSNGGYWIEATIEHEVGGKVYRRVDKGPSAKLSSDLTFDVPKAGSRVSCYYVDGHPDLVTIFPGRETHTAVYVGFAAFVFLLPIPLYLLNERQRRRRGLA